MVAMMEDEEKLLAQVHSRARGVVRLVEVADKVCAKMEHPTESVTILDQEELRAAIEAVRSL